MDQKCISSANMACHPGGIYWYMYYCPESLSLTHWGWVIKITIIGSHNGLSPGRRQDFIWTNAGILLIGPLGTNFSEILIKILIFSFKKMRLKVSSGKWRPFCLGLNVLSQSTATDLIGHPPIMVPDLRMHYRYYVAGYQYSTCSTRNGCKPLWVIHVRLPGGMPHVRCSYTVILANLVFSLLGFVDFFLQKFLFKIHNHLSHMCFHIKRHLI